MRAYLGVTDFEWYRALSELPQPVDEVNFWFPSSAQGFAALSPSEYFVLKTHVLRGGGPMSNRIVGVGAFSGFARLRISEAFSWFGVKNGVADLAEFRDRISHYRRTSIGPNDDPEIGCVILNEPLFFPPSQPLPAPDDFSNNIVRGKGYLLDSLDAAHPVSVAVANYLLRDISIDRVDPSGLIYDRTHGSPRLITPRVGQGAFKAVTAEAYHHRCALTGERVRPVLQAAHIRPISAGGEHRLDNALLLRSDVHTLFDRGYIAFDTRYRLRVSPALRTEFGNGDYFYAREGNPISTPDRPSDRPNAGFLEWHNEVVFRA